MSNLRSSATRNSIQSFRFKSQPVTVSRKSRKASIGLTLHSSGRIGISAPKGTRLKVIRSILKKNAAWIDEHLSRFEILRASHPRHEFREGDRFFLFGRELILIRKPGSGTISFAVRDGQLIANVSKDCDRIELQDALIKFYRKIGSLYMKARVEKYRRKMKVRPASIRFSSQKTRWGSCSAAGRITLDWRLVFAPPEVIDYVIVHELAHLRHFDHSPKFWALVATHVPFMEARKQWLVEHQYGADFLTKRSELHPNAS